VTRRTPLAAFRLGFPAVLALVGVLLAGCPEDHPITPGDGAVTGDSPSLTTVDTDMDWVCDNTELLRETRLDDPDTDGDGYSDFVEIANGYDPLLPSSPPREEILLMRETATATLQEPIEQVVFGEGQSFQGGLEAYMARDLTGATAATYFQRTTAVVANPPENVADIIEDEARFLNVIGRTLLVFEVHFAFGSELPRGCNRAYPMRYTVKRDDGTFVGSRRLLLVVLPEGSSIEAGNWCMPAGGCL
jgi:hypothetical protein